MHRGHGKAALAGTDKGTDVPETLVLLTELESEIRAVVARAGGKLPAHDQAGGGEESVDDRVKLMLSDLRSSGLTSQSDHAFPKAA